MDVDGPPDFGMDAAMDFDLGGYFLIPDDGVGRAASESSLTFGSARKRKANNNVRLFIFSNYSINQGSSIDIGFRQRCAI